MKFDLERVWLNVRNASTEDLLDRITVFRQGMEPDALPIIEAELRDRGVGREEIEAHKATLPEFCIHHADGAVAQCNFCRKPAVTEAWTWFRLWGVLPVFPWKVRYCQTHAPGETKTDAEKRS